jgi:hypothetical protein
VDQAGNQSRVNIPNTSPRSAKLFSERNEHLHRLDLHGHKHGQIFAELLDEKNTSPWPLVRERTIPTERPPTVDEI